MKTKVLMIGPTPPPPGGVAIVLQTLLNSSLSDEYDLCILDTARKRRRYKIVGGLGPLSILYLILHLIKLNYLLLKEKPSIVHIQADPAGFLRDSLFIILANLWQKKVICHLHGFYSEKNAIFKYVMLRWYFRLIMNHVDVLILLSSSFVPEFAHIAPKTRKVVVPNLVSQNALKDLDSLKAKTKPETNVLFMGRLSMQKGTYDLLKVASFLKKDGHIRFLLAGLGRTQDDEERIVTQIDRDRLKDTVKLLGYVEGQRKAELFENSDIFVLPSYTEVFPVVIVEAMAAAMPVIATPVGAIPEIIEDGVNGFIVPSGDWQLLAERIRYLVRHPEKRVEIGRNNLEKFRQQYLAETNIYAIHEVYQSLTRQEEAEL